jgi:hypothetical protein
MRRREARGVLGSHSKGGISPEIESAHGDEDQTGKAVA